MSDVIKVYLLSEKTLGCLLELLETGTVFFFMFFV